MRAVRRRAFALLAPALAAVFVIAPSAGARHDATSIPALALSWRAPTPDDGQTYKVPLGSTLSIGFAVASDGGAARIWASGLPPRAVLTAGSRKPATAQLNWTPSKGQIGTHAFVFAAGSGRSRPGRGRSSCRSSLRRRLA